MRISSLKPFLVLGALLESNFWRIDVGTYVNRRGGRTSLDRRQNLIDPVPRCGNLFAM
jgi:hypothetical protein